MRQGESDRPVESHDLDQGGGGQVGARVRESLGHQSKAVKQPVALLKDPGEDRPSVGGRREKGQPGQGQVYKGCPSRSGTPAQGLA